MAAAISGVFPVCLDQQRSCIEDDEMKKKQVALMERLRSKRSSQHRSWTDSLMKSIRTTVVDRRLQADSSERSQVQTCLDTLQRAMKVISQQSLVERLELVARQQGLAFQSNSSDQPSVTLQADMFHIEIILNKGGGVKEVKIAHQGEASVCHELTDILGRGDFSEFTSHLEGLQSIYRVAGEKKLKSKAFQALQSLENDLNHVAQFQTSISGVANYIHKSPLGILLPRTAGKPMKLIYFVSPYDLLDKKTLSAHPMTVEEITEHGLGRSVTVCLESGPSTRLQTSPLMSVNKIPDGNCLPLFNQLTHTNSAHLPAHFVLVLPQPIPVAMSILQKIQSHTEVDTGKDKGSQPLLSLILDSNSDGKMKKDQQLFVSLPDQHHRYFINGVAGGLLDEPGVMLSRIPFSHPVHVPKILSLLRQQLLFNSVLASCVRPGAKKDPTSSLVFEMTVISLTQMVVVFEHPAYDTMVTVDIDMSDITNLKCHMLCTGAEQSLCSDDYASRVLQRCLSLPVLLRSLIRKGRSQLEKLMAEAKALAEEQARRAQEAALWAATQVRQQQSRFPPNIPTKGRPPPPQPPPPHLTPTYPPTPSPVTSNPPSVGGLGDLRGIPGGVDLLGSSPPGYPAVGPGGDSQDKQNNPLLVNLLDNERAHTSPAGGTAQQQQQQQAGMPVTESPMLSRLLEDNISVATNINPISVIPTGLQQPAQPKPKGTKGRKRRSQSDLPAGRSPKHRISDSDPNERYSSLDLDSSSSPFESSLGGSGGLPGFHHQMGPTPPRPPSQGHMSSVIDLTEENMPESSLKKLVDLTREGFMQPMDIKPAGATTPDSELQALLSKQDHNSSPSAGLKPNQVTGSKNENASTSPEGLLIGSGEVGKASLPDPAAVHPKVQTPSRTSPPSTTLAAFLGHGPAATKARRDCDVNVHPQQPGGPFPPQQDLNSLPHHHTNMGGLDVGASAPPATPVTPRPKVVSSSSMTEMLDVKPAPLTGKKVSALKPQVSADSALDKRGLFEKFDFTGQTAATATTTHVTISSSSITSASSVMEGDDLTAPKVRLKLHQFRTPHNKSVSLDSGVVQSPSSAGSRSSNTFDFRSDEDDDEPVTMNYVATDRLAVYSSSPTCLQISSKGKPPTPLSTPETSPSVKPEKYKRKDKGSGNAKRKKDRDDSKKERKKKKFDHDHYLPTGKEHLYRASTVESDQKCVTKLKIRVSKEPIKTLSPVKESSRMDMNSEKVGKFSEKVNDAFRRRATPSSPVVEKLVLQKQDVRDHHAVGDETSRDRDVVQYRSSLSASGKSSLKSGASGKAGMVSSNSMLSKADPKLAKATIRLKPLNMTSATSASVTLTPPVKTTSSGRGASDRSERRSQSLSTSTSVSTPTSGTLSLSSILPNAPTASSVASLPPIPKIPKAPSMTSNSTTTAVTSASVKSSSGVANNSVKNSTINSGLNSSVNKVSGSPAMGQGGRGGSNSNTPNTLKSPGVGFNKTGGPGTVQKTSPNVPGHKASGNASMPPGILKNCGNNSQSGSNSQKAPAAGNQGLHKGPGGPNQASGTYNRVPNSANQMGGAQKSALSSQALAKNLPNQNVGHKGSGSAGNLPRGNSGLQKGPGLGQGGLQRSPSVQNQGGMTKLSGSPNQSSGSQKSGPPGRTTSPAMGPHRNLPQGSNPPQKNSAQGSNFGSKHQGPVTSNSAGFQGQGQKLPGNQGRSVSTSGYSPSPSLAGRPTGSVRNNSVSGNGSGNRAPPNHLPVNRSVLTPGQKAGSGSSPRTSASHSPSNPSAPRFPGNSPQQKNSGASPSGASQRSGSTSQASSQRNSNSSQTSTSQRSSSTPSQRQSSSPQTPRLASNNLSSSPNQRPASNPGPAGDPRLPSSGTDHSPGYPARPSSAGPRQSSSPVGPKQTPSTGQGSTSSPSGSRTSSPGGQGQRGVGSGTGVSPLVSHQPTGGGAADTVPLSRQNSSGSLNPPAVSRQNSGVSSSTGFAVSRQNSSTNSSAVMAMSRQNSSSSSTVSTVSQQNSGTGSSSPSMSRLNSSANSTSSSVSRQNSNSGAGGSNSVPRPSSNSGCGTAGASPASSQSASASVSVAAPQARSAPTATPTSGKQLTSGSTSSSTVVSASRTSSAVMPGAQQTSPGISVRNAGAAKSGGVNGGKAAASKVAAGGAGGPKAASSGANGGSSVNKGASASKMNTTANAVPASVKTATSSVGRSVPSVGIVSSSASVAAGPAAKSGAGPKSAANPTSSSLGSSCAMGPRTPHTLSSTASTKSSSTALSSATSSSSLVSSASSSSISSAAVSSSAAGGKAAVAGAARGRKGSLSAIVDKLATRMSASSGPGTEGGECPGGSAGNALSMGSVPRVAEALLERQKSATDEGVDEEMKTGVKRPASASGLSPPSSEPKVQRLESHSKLASTTTTTTTTTSTPTPTTTPSPAHTTPPHTSSSAAAALHSAMERQRSGSVGEKSNLLQQRDLGEVGLDLSIPKDKTKPESTLTPLPPPRPDSRGRASPKESNSSRSGSPAVGLDKVVSGTKFNGDSSKDKTHLENEVFKVPTPKTQSCEETEERSGGNSGGGGGARTVGASPVCSVNSRSFPNLASPLSDASSPENELVIDCGDAPSLANSRTASSRATVGAPVMPIHPSPKRVVELASEGVAPAGVGRTSPGLGSGKVSPSPGTRGVKNSPQQSSQPKCSPSLPSPSPAPNDAGANSPCEIDDDLMDAALMGFNAS